MVRSFSLNHIDVMVSILGGPEWRFTGIYGFPEDENKMKTCMLLKSLGGVTEMPWLCGGGILISCYGQWRKKEVVTLITIMQLAFEMPWTIVGW